MAIEHIVSRIRVHQAMRAYRPGPRRRKMPRQQPPDAIEADYAHRLVSIVHVIQPTVDRVVRELHGMRQDAGELHRIRALFAHAQHALTAAIAPGVLDALARRYAHATSAFQKAQLARQVQAAIGIDIATHDRHVPEMIDRFAHENVALIRKLGNATLADIETITARAFRTGQRAESVAKDLAARMGVHERHARLIARDQIGGINGLVNDARQRELGINEWRWRTVRDNRVRPTHKTLEAMSEDVPFSDENPALEDGVPVLPGQPVLCRCYREPVFDSLLEAAA